MNRLAGYLKVDWQAMTVQDWIGFVVTVTIFLLMIGLYLYVFRPKNRKKLESHRFITMDDD